MKRSEIAFLMITNSRHYQPNLYGDEMVEDYTDSIAEFDVVKK